MNGVITNATLASPTITGTAIGTGVLPPGMLVPSGVTPGNYSSANITVNPQGIITAASNGSGTSYLPLAGGTMTGSILNATLPSPTITGLVVGAGVIPDGALVSNGVTAGSYTTANITVNAQGLITAASSGSASGYLPLSGGTMTGPIVGASLTSPTFTGTASGAGTIPFTMLTTTGVTAGSYTSANITVNAEGLITNASNGSGGSGVTGPGSSTNGYVPVWNGTTGGALSAGLPTANSSSPNALIESNSSGYLASNFLSGGYSGITAVGTISSGIWQGTPIASSYLANTAVTAGSYTNSNITVNAEGQITAASNGSGSGGVSTISVVSANGFAGTVANPTTTPAITLTTSISGVLKGSSSALAAATAGTDYIAPTSTTPTQWLLQFPTNTVVSNDTYWFSANFPNTSGQVLSVTAATGGSSTPSFNLSIQINGTPVTGCSAITVSSSTLTTTTCTTTSIAKTNTLTAVITGVSGLPSYAQVQVNGTRSLN